MKTYDETIESIFAKGDAIIERKKIQIKKIERTSAAVSGLCAAAIVGVSVWHLSSSGNMKNNFNENNIVDNVEKNTKPTENPSDIVTTKDVTTACTTKTDINTTKGTNIVSSTQNTSVAIAEGSTQTKPVPTTQKTENTNPISTTIQITQPNTTTISITTQIESPTTTPEIPTNYESNLKNKFIEIIFEDGFDPETNNTFYKSYIATKVSVNNEMIENRIYEKHIKTEYDENNELKTIETDIEIYKVKNISKAAIIAVKFKDSNNYYIYFDKKYHPESLNDLISDLDLSFDGIDDTAYISNKEYKGFETEEIWKIITQNTNLPNDDKYCREYGIVVVPKISFSYTSNYINAIGGSIGISENGYLFTNIGRNGSYFYIGEDRAQEIIGYVMENNAPKSTD